MKQCRKCRSTDTTLVSSFQLPTLEYEYTYQCSDCKKSWQVYEDMDAEAACDMKLYLEMQREERGDY